jgi:hypothetical protein
MLAVLYAWILLTTDSFMKEHGFTAQHLTQRDIRDVGGTIALQMEGQGSVLMCPCGRWSKVGPSGLILPMQIRRARAWTAQVAAALAGRY